MKTENIFAQALVVISALILTVASARIAHAEPAQLLQVRFSEKTKVIQVLGRSSPELGVGLIRIDVPSKYIKFVTLGQSINVTSSIDSRRIFRTKVIEILPPIGSNDTTRGVRLAHAQPPLGAGDSVVNAQVVVPLDGSGIKVPTEAVAFANGRHYVIKKTAAGETAIPIQIYSETDDSLSIRPLPGADLSNGDSILATRAIYSLPQLIEAKAN